MHIFIDESGSFTHETSDDRRISAVGSLVIPTSSMKGFDKLYGRLRKRLPKRNGEVKGRLLNEKQVGEVANILRKIGSIFEVCVVDMAIHTEDGIVRHKEIQEENITRSLTSEHHPNVVQEVWKLREILKRLPIQLYVQSVALSQLIYNTIQYADLYYVFRNARELGEYHWVIDAKDRSRITPWEEWWSIVILPFIESKTLRKPMIMVEGGDYRWQERLRTDSISDYKQQLIDYHRLVDNPREGSFLDLKPVLTEDFRFSPDSEFGLEAVDVLTNTIRRSLSGNFQREGWLAVRPLMVARREHYINVVSLMSDDKAETHFPYMAVLNDFFDGGRPVIPSGVTDESLPNAIASL